MAARSQDETKQATPRVDLDDVLLYYIAKAAEQHTGDLKIPIPRIHRAMSRIEPVLKRLRIGVRFHTNPIEVYSSQVEEALKLLVPYEIEIRNPRFVVLLRKDAAGANLERIETRIPPEVRVVLDEGLATFEEEIEA